MILIFVIIRFIPVLTNINPRSFADNHHPQATDTELLQARENLMETTQAFLNEYNHIPPDEKCMALFLADERFLKIKQAVEEEQNQPETEQEEPAAQNFLINLNFPMADDDEYTSIDHSEILSDSNDDGTSSDDDDFEDIEYVSLEEVNNDQEEKEFDLEDILQIQDVILREKLLNISRLITNIESLNDNPTPDRVLKSPFSFPIPVTDSDSFFEKSDTSFSYSDNSLPEFETFSDHTEETRSGSTTTHANNSLPEYDSFLF
ncbi:hypothetical protein Tco_0452162 [Tanacetum coccineum]